VEGLLHGLIIGISTRGQELIGFLFLRIGKLSIPIYSKKRLHRLCSDHFPILDCGGIPRGGGGGGGVVAAKDILSLRICRYVVKKAEGFVDRVRRWWLSYRFHGSPSFILVQKLKALKADLKIWNEQMFGNVEIHKKALLEELCALESLEEVRAFVNEEKLRKCVVISELEKDTLLETKFKGSLDKRG
jgi:hypothetical protein